MNRKCIHLTVITTYLTSSLLTSPLMAQELLPAKSSPANTMPVTDVTLSPQGSFAGQLLSKQGQAIDGARIMVSQDKTLVMETTTNKEGLFVVTGLKNGVYKINSPQQAQLIRVWNQDIAPKSAKSSVVMVQGETAMRGQFGYIDPVTGTALGLGIAGIVIGLSAKSDVDDLERVVRRLRSP